MKTGVYVVEHRESGKKYVGSAARSFYGRWHGHRSRLRKGTHHSVLLQRAWNKYGEDAFEFRVIEPCLPEHATGVEQVFIDWYKSTDPKFGYNICHIAGSTLGVKYTDEAKAKLSAARKGRKHTAERRAKRIGTKASAEHCAKISAAAIGRKASAEARANMSAAQRGNKHNLGRKASAEARAKISAGMMGRKVSAETRAKISAALMGNKYAAKKEATTCLARD